MSERRRRRRSLRGRLRPSEAILGVSAFALLATMLLPWFAAGNEKGNLLVLVDTETEGTAWQALDLISPFLALTCLIAIGAVALRFLGSGWSPAIVPGAGVAVLGGLAAGLILFRLLVPPDVGTPAGLGVDVSPQLGAFLGLGAALGIACGGYRAMREEGSSFAAVADSLQPRPGRSASRKR